MSKKVRLLLKHFNDSDHNFDHDSEFTLTEQIRKPMTSEETRKLLKIQENFWILKVKALYPDELSQEINDTD